MKLVDEAIDELLPRLDVLVHSAGMAPPGRMAVTSPETYQQLIDVNLVSTATPFSHAIQRKDIPTRKDARCPTSILRLNEGPRDLPSPAVPVDTDGPAMTPDCVPNAVTVGTPCAHRSVPKTSFEVRLPSSSLFDMDRLFLIVSLPAFLAACGGERVTDVDASASDGGGGSATCETLTDPSVCWTVAVADLYACVPNETGELSADRTSCSFSDGTTIVFASALPTTTDSFLPDLVIRRPDDSECGTFFERDSTREATADGLTASLVQEGSPSTLTLLCNGDVALMDTFSNVLACASEGAVLPSWSAVLDDTTAAVTVRSAGTAGPLFTCVAP